MITKSKVLIGHRFTIRYRGPAKRAGARYQVTYHGIETVTRYFPYDHSRPVGRTNFDEFLTEMLPKCGLTGNYEASYVETGDTVMAYLTTVSNRAKSGRPLGRLE
jgi:hypothetical protein